MKLSQILPLVVSSALATSFVAWEKPAQAIQVFNFSFDNTSSDTRSVNGTVSGTLNLPDGNGTFAATSITINSAPAALGYTTPVEVLSYFTTVANNSFTVSNGQITTSVFGAFTQDFSEEFGLEYGSDGSILYKSFGASYTFTQDKFSATLTYTPATPVPWDMTPSAILPTIPILALMYRWKQSRNRIGLKTINKLATTVSTGDELRVS